MDLVAEENPDEDSDDIEINIVEKTPITQIDLVSSDDDDDMSSAVLMALESSDPELQKLLDVSAPQISTSSIAGYSQKDLNELLGDHYDDDNAQVVVFDDVPVKPKDWAKLNADIKKKNKAERIVRKPRKGKGVGGNKQTMKAAKAAAGTPIKLAVIKTKTPVKLVTPWQRFQKRQHSDAWHAEFDAQEKSGQPDHVCKELASQKACIVTAQNRLKYNNGKLHFPL